jgi:hypothetical protein
VATPNPFARFSPLVLQIFAYIGYLRYFGYVGQNGNLFVSIPFGALSGAVARSFCAIFRSFCALVQAYATVVHELDHVHGQLDEQRLQIENLRAEIAARDATLQNQFVAAAVAACNQQGQNLHPGSPIVPAGLPGAAAVPLAPAGLPGAAAVPLAPAASAAPVVPIVPAELPGARDVPLAPVPRAAFAPIAPIVLRPHRFD